MIPLLLACDPYADWPAPGSYFPYVYQPEADVEAYEEVAWETETWTPEDDPDQLALYLLKAQMHRPGAPDEVVEHFAGQAVPPLAGAPTISAVGDVMWVGDNWSHFADGAAALLDGSTRVGNLETPVSALHSTEPGALGLYAFNAPDTMLEGLPLDLVQLNNNHSLDAGDDGLAATLESVAAHGYAHTGVDAHRALEGVAWHAYTWGTNVRESSAFELFIEPFGHEDPIIDWHRVARDFAEVEAQHRVVLLHWGYEYEYYPRPQFMVAAREFIALGADLVLGQGPHVVQPVELCSVNRPEVVPGVGACSLRTDDGEPRTAAVVYSLGNFATAMATVPCQVGIVASILLDEGGVAGLGWEAVATVDGPEVLPLDSLLDAADYAAESARLDEHLGRGWRR